MNSLFLVRHADSPFTNHQDHQRPLSELGKQQATQTAAFIRHHCQQQTVTIVTSSAVRTRNTADIIAQQLTVATQSAHDALYLAQVGQWCDVMLAHDLDTPLILVGHNPTITQTAHHLNPASKLLFKPACAAHFMLEIAPDGLKLPAQLLDFFDPHAK